ncbi:alanine racemase [Marinomonas agarivorans]|nr:alanine racemase [Marinomonas agarivorans]
MSRPLKTYVDLEAIKHNYLLAKSLHPDNPAFAVVKANAYGHGAIEVSRFLDGTVDAFAVAAIDEALPLREAGIKSPIFLLEGTFSVDELQLCEANNFWIAIENEQQLQHFLDNLVTLDKVFVKVDVGMHRLGVKPEKVNQYIETIQATGRAKDIVLMAHFSSADEWQGDVTPVQQACFANIQASYPELSTSIANSATILKWPVPSGSWLRPGLMLYGISPFADISADTLGLKSAMTFVSQIISLRQVADGEGVGYSHAYKTQGETTIATVAVGYGDGYPRTLNFSTPLVIRGKTCFLAGRVSMDMITVDVTHLADVAIGDPVLLWGADNPVEQVANHAQTIGYELVTRMTGRSPISYDTKPQLLPT